MVSPWVAGALKGLEKGFAQRELQKQKDIKNALALRTLQQNALKNKISNALAAARIKKITREAGDTSAADLRKEQIKKYKADEKTRKQQNEFFENWVTGRKYPEQMKAIKGQVAERVELEHLPGFEGTDEMRKKGFIQDVKPLADKYNKIKFQETADRLAFKTDRKKFIAEKVLKDPSSIMPPWFKSFEKPISQYIFKSRMASGAPLNPLPTKLEIDNAKENVTKDFESEELFKDKLITERKREEEAKKTLAIKQLTANYYNETLKELNKLYPDRDPELNIKEATQKSLAFKSMLEVAGPATIRNLGYEQREKNKLNNRFLGMKKLFGGKVSDEVLKMAVVKGWQIEIVDGTPFMINRIDPSKSFVLPSGQRLMNPEIMKRIFRTLSGTPTSKKQVDPDTEWNIKSKKRQEQVDSSRPYYKGPTVSTSDPRRFTYPSFKAIGTNRLTEEYQNDFTVHGPYKTNYWDSRNIGNVSLSKAVGDMTLSTGGAIQNLMNRIGIAGLWPKLFSPKAQAFRSKIQSFKINMLRGLDEAGQKKFSWLQKKLDSIFRVDKAGYFKSIGAMKGELIALTQNLNNRLMYLNNQLDPKKSWTGLKAGSLRKEKFRLEYMLTQIGNPYRIDTGEKTPVSSILRAAKGLNLPTSAIKQIEKYERKMKKNETIGGTNILSITILPQDKNSKRKK